MFGRRGNDSGSRETPVFRSPATPPPGGSGVPVLDDARASHAAADVAAPKRVVEAPPMAPEPPRRAQRDRGDSYYDTKSQVFSALIDTIDLSQLAKLEPDAAREEIRDIVNDIIAIKNFAMSIAEQEELLEDICNDVLGYGPLEPLLARDDIADIM